MRSDFDPGAPFDRIEIAPPSGSRLVLGAFLLTEEILPEGDLNLDGAIDEIDLAVFRSLYRGEGEPAYFWSRDADFDSDGDVDEADYTSLRPRLANAPDCALVVRSLPDFRRGVVQPDEEITLTVDVADLEGGDVTYTWAASSGQFDRANAATVKWTALL